MNHGPDLAWRTNPPGSLQEIGNNVQAAKVALSTRRLSPASKHHPKSGAVPSTVASKNKIHGEVLQGGKGTWLMTLKSWWKFMPHAGCLRDGKTTYPISYLCIPYQKKVCTALPVMTTCDLKGQGFGMYWRREVFLKFPQIQQIDPLQISFLPDFLWLLVFWKVELISILFSILCLFGIHKIPAHQEWSQVRRVALVCTSRYLQHNHLHTSQGRLPEKACKETGADMAKPSQ